MILSLIMTTIMGMVSTDVGQVLDEASLSALISAWALAAVLVLLLP